MIVCFIVDDVEVMSFDGPVSRAEARGLDSFCEDFCDDCGADSAQCYSVDRSYLWADLGWALEH